MNKTGYRGTNHKVIECEDCGAHELRPVNAFFCLSCAYRRMSQHKVERQRELRKSPAYRNRMRRNKREWAQRERARRWDVRCEGCRKPMPMIAGRHRTGIRCDPCRKIHIRARRRARYEAEKAA